MCLKLCQNQDDDDDDADDGSLERGSLSSGSLPISECSQQTNSKPRTSGTSRIHAAVRGGGGHEDSASQVVSK